MSDSCDRTTVAATPLVLVVDDERGIRFTISEILGKAGIPTITADCAEACLETLRSGFKGLILMDVMMPDISGWDTIRRIRDNGLLPGNLIVMLTALDTPDQAMDGLQEVVLDYLVKPVRAGELIPTVQKYLSYLDLSRLEN